ncbi:MAG: hypothetical protein COW30_06420 [Rhodospirillales bacterium CG15_BIG_FIL_POST_REV_8_21_14_020_66_15]|nr:MAG: hypothetical protein COW30_06420 [Rhodospirillales bacterium CG15_BIG_FIL_POST_REV_8_21_14_020_66_15]
MRAARMLALAVAMTAAVYVFPSRAELYGSPTAIIPAEVLKDPDLDYRSAFLLMTREKDTVGAYELFLKAADRGHPQAQYFVAIFQREGKAVAKDLPRALEWAKKSVEGGFLRAADLVGAMYLQGEGVEKSPGEAFTWYEKAAKAGFPQSQFFIALAYTEGLGTSKDPAKALEWGRKAADAGFPPAKGFVAALEKRIPQIKRENGLVTRLLPPSVGYTEHLEKLHLRPMENSAEIVAELKKDSAKLKPPYLYELARRLWPTDQSEAISWYLAGYMRAKFDAFKCKDKSARGGYRLLSALAPEVAKGLRERTDLLIAAGQKALEIEATYPVNTDPIWICRHGLDTMIAGLEKKPLIEYTTDPKTWPEIREKLRSGLLVGLQKIIDKQASK